jgi:hypothetical protein
MDWSEFNRLPTRQKIAISKQQGVKMLTDFVVKWDGTRAPAAFVSHPDCYYHFDADMSGQSQALVWANGPFSPDGELIDLVQTRHTTVLDDTYGITRRIPRRVGPSFVVPTARV